MKLIGYRTGADYLDSMPSEVINGLPRLSADDLYGPEQTSEADFEGHPHRRNQGMPTTKNKSSVDSIPTTGNSQRKQRRHRQRTLKPAPVSAAEIREAIGILPESVTKAEKIHLVALDASDRRPADGLVWHTQTVPLPDGAYMYIGGDVCVPNPELSFLQMASILTFEQLVMYGYRLCSTYSIPPGTNRMRQRRFPLTNVAKLSQFIQQMKGSRGIKAARKALKYIVDMSASPLESNVTIMCVMPPRLGGYNIYKPRLNERIDFDAIARAICGQSYAKCDLAWLEAMFAVEIDSALYHSADTQIAHDQKRAEAIESMGVDLMSFTSDKIHDFRQFHYFAMEIAKKLGMHLHPVNAETFAKRERLHGILFGQLDLAA